MAGTPIIKTRYIKLLSGDRLPQGLRINPQKGTIQGHPVLINKEHTRLLLHIKTPYGEDSEYVTVNEEYKDKPNLSYIPMQTVYGGESYSFTPSSANAVPTSDFSVRNPIWTASPLPQGISIDPHTGTLSGTPTEVSSRSITTTLQVTTNKGKASQQFTFKIIAVAPPPNHCYSSPDSIW